MDVQISRLLVSWKHPKSTDDTRKNRDPPFSLQSPKLPVYVVLPSQNAQRDQLADIPCNAPNLIAKVVVWSQNWS